MKIGSLFSGIGGLEYGLELAIPFANVLWQVEQDDFCRKVLAKHWPKTKRFNNVHDVGAHNLQNVDLICGGFPCQDISVAGKREGLDGKKSSLWFEMSRIIDELRPRIAVLENVPAITNRGMDRVLGSLAEMGYDAEWTELSARAFGAPHLRRRWFLVAYSNSAALRLQQISHQRSKEKSLTRNYGNQWRPSPAHTTGAHSQEYTKHTISMETESRPQRRSRKATGIHPGNHWRQPPPEPTIRRVDDGIPRRMGRRGMKALGNAVVPQCAQYIGQAILNSGLVDDLLPQPSIESPFPERYCHWDI